MLTGSNYWEYIEVKLDHNNLYSHNGRSVTLKELGFDRWELVLLSPIVMYDMVADPNQIQNYFVSKSELEHIDYIKVPCYSLIFKRTAWVEE